MPDPNPITALFPVAQCEKCGKTVLTAVALDDDGRESRRCAHCDAQVAGRIDWITAAELEATGYQFGAPREPTGGCGSGCGGGCSTRRQ
jgi:hypothetical protein